MSGLVRALNVKLRDMRRILWLASIVQMEMTGTIKTATELVRARAAHPPGLLPARRQARELF